MKTGRTDFVHLNCHSFYSMPTGGASSPRELAERAKRLGMLALAITDTNGLYGIPAFLKAAKETGIKPVVGVEIDTTSGSPSPASSETDGEGSLPEEPARLAQSDMRARCVCIAAGSGGYAALCRIVTGLRLAPRVKLADLLASEAGHIIALTPSPVLLKALRDRMEPGRLFAELHGFPSSLRAMRGVTYGSIRSLCRKPVLNHI
jgi:error-prone DNA polymerase